MVLMLMLLCSMIVIDPLLIYCNILLQMKNSFISTTVVLYFVQYWLNVVLNIAYYI